MARIYKTKFNLKGFQGFWCRHCEGRIFFDEIYTEIHPETKEKRTKVELTCLLCARNYRCELKDYLGLLENIERILIKKRAAKNRKTRLLSG